MLEQFYNLLTAQGMNLTTAVTVSRWLTIVSTLLLALLGYVIARRIALPMLFYSIDRSETNADNILREFRPFRRLIWLVPLAILYGMAPLALEGYANLVQVVQNVLLLAMIGVGLIVVNAFLDGAVAIYEQRDIVSELPLRSFIQVLRIAAFLVAGILAIAVLINRTPGALLAGLGALSAVMMLVFQDPILGLVAGIQLTGNKLVARGDFIEVPKYDASGEVLEIALTTVKVRNADQTITTVPTYSLISESFKNWRGLEETLARRIMRAVIIDVETVRFCTEEMLARYRTLPLVADALAEYAATADNAATAVPDREQVANGNGRGLAHDRLTNLTVLRAYLTAYLRRHPAIYADRTIVVRQQPQTADGVPLEVIAYTPDIQLAPYERVQSDIFDHVLAIVPAFDLRLFQNPTGRDVRPVAPDAAPSV